MNLAISRVTSRPKKGRAKVPFLIVALITVIGLSMAACPMDLGDDDSFVPVTRITRIPDAGEVDANIILNGRINPSSATNKTVEWTLVEDKTESATLTGSVLKATATGKITVNAIIKNGTAEGDDYDEDFVIEIFPQGTITKVESVIVSPKTTLVQKGRDQQFDVLVKGTNISQNVSWEIDNPQKHHPETFIDKQGMLTVASGETNKTLTVRATSRRDVNVSDTATVTVSDIVDSTPVRFESVIANGSPNQTTTQLTLTFSERIVGLSASDITISGVSNVRKGTLSGTGPTYTLSITVAEGGTLGVKVAQKPGYTITDSTQQANIFYYNPFPGTWTGTFPIGESGSRDVDVPAELNFTSAMTWTLKTERYLVFNESGTYTCSGNDVTMLINAGNDFGEGTLGTNTLSLTIVYLDRAGTFTKR